MSLSSRQIQLLTGGLLPQMPEPGQTAGERPLDRLLAGKIMPAAATAFGGDYKEPDKSVEEFFHNVRSSVDSPKWGLLSFPAQVTSEVVQGATGLPVGSEELQKYHPIISGVAQGAGYVAPLLLSGGASEAVPIAARLLMEGGKMGMENVIQEGLGQAVGTRRPDLMNQLIEGGKGFAYGTGVGLTGELIGSAAKAGEAAWVQRTAKALKAAQESGDADLIALAEKNAERATKGFSPVAKATSQAVGQAGAMTAMGAGERSLAGEKTTKLDVARDFAVGLALGVPGIARASLESFAAKGHTPDEFTKREDVVNHPDMAASVSEVLNDPAHAEAIKKDMKAKFGDRSDDLLANLKAAMSPTPEAAATPSPEVQDVTSPVKPTETTPTSTTPAKVRFGVDPSKILAWQAAVDTKGQPMKFFRQSDADKFIANNFPASGYKAKKQAQAADAQNGAHFTVSVKPIKGAAEKIVPVGRPAEPQVAATPRDVSLEGLTAELQKAMPNLKPEEAHAAATWYDEITRGQAEKAGVPHEQFKQENLPDFAQATKAEGGLMQIPEGFYSKAARVAESKLPVKGIDPTVAEKTLLNNDVKPDEIKWLLSDLFETAKGEGRTLSRQEILDHIDANKAVEIKDVTLSNEVQDPNARSGKGLYPERPTQYQQYKSLPGGTDYRELVVTLPNAPGEYKSGHWPEKNPALHIRYDTRTDADGKRVMFVHEMQSDWAREGREEGFAPSYNWNDLSHIEARPDGEYGEYRIVVVDSKGNKLDTPSLYNDKDAADGYVEYINNRLKNKPSDRAGIIRAFAEDQTVAKVPDAPFVRKWQELAAKKVLQYAAKEGFDRVTWATGEQVAKTYDLRKHLSEVHYYYHTDSGTGELMGYDHEGKEAFDKRDILPDQLASVIGKDPAQKILADLPNAKEAANGLKHVRLSEEGLGIGGEWAQNLYDREMPAIFDKIGKRFGVKSGTASLGESRVDYNLEEVVPPDQVHSLDITPEMRASIKEGQELFQQAKGATPKGEIKFNAGENGRDLIRIFKSHDVSTAIHELGHNWLHVSLQNDLLTPELTHILKRSAMDHVRGSFGKDSQEFRDAERAFKNKSASTEVHEYFARGLERYLREGKTDNPRLVPIFEKFRVWLTNIYRKIKGSSLDVKLSKDMQTFFDTMHGADRSEALAGYGAKLAERQARGRALLEAHRAGKPVTVWDYMPPVIRTHDAEGRPLQGGQELWDALKGSKYQRRISKTKGVPITLAVDNLLASGDAYPYGHDESTGADHTSPSDVLNDMISFATHGVAERGSAFTGYTEDSNAKWVRDQEDREIQRLADEQNITPEEFLKRAAQTQKAEPSSEEYQEPDAGFQMEERQKGTKKTPREEAESSVERVVKGLGRGKYTRTVGDYANSGATVFDEIAFSRDLGIPSLDIEKFVPFKRPNARLGVKALALPPTENEVRNALPKITEYIRQSRERFEADKQARKEEDFFPGNREVPGGKIVKDAVSLRDRLPKLQEREQQILSDMKHNQAVVDSEAKLLQKTKARGNLTRLKSELGKLREQMSGTKQDLFEGTSKVEPDQITLLQTEEEKRKGFVARSAEATVQDAREQLASAGKAVHSVSDDLLKIVAPAARAGAAPSAYNLRELGSIKARTDDVIRKATEEYAKFFDKHGGDPRDSESNSYKFAIAAETNDPSALPPELQPAVKLVHTINDHLLSEVQKRGGLKGILSSAQKEADFFHDFFIFYWGRLWKDPEKAAEIFARLPMSTKRPFESWKSFMKRRTLELYQDGIAAGLEPLYANPMDMFFHKATEVTQWIKAQDYIAREKGKSRMKMVRASDKPPDGWIQLDDRVATITYRNEKGELVIAGHYYAPEANATVFNNHVSEGLSKSALYRGYKGMANIMNQWQLGLSAFHAGFTTLDAMTSSLALAVKELSEGRLGAAAIHLLETPIAGFTTAMRGRRLLKAWENPEIQTPEQAALFEAIMAGGGRAHMDRFYQTTIARKFLEQMHKGNFLGVGMRAPFAAMEQAMKPILEHLVPWQKMGVIAEMAKSELAKNPNMSHEEMQKAMAKIVDSGDNRLGQMIYDNGFWAKWMKDLGMASVRSLGWNLGTIREIVGGLADAPIDITRAIKSGKWNGISNRTAYVIALPMMVGGMGAIINYLATGESPETLKDYFYPRVGGVDAKGRPNRIALPSYMKDIYHYSTEPGRTLQNKLHPMIGTMADMLENKDFYGVEIRHPDDPWVKQALDMLEYPAKQMIPISFRNIQQNVAQKEGAAKAALPFVGVIPAPASIQNTAAENMIQKINASKISSAPRTKENADKSRLIHELTWKVRTGSPDAERMINDARQSSAIDHEDVLRIRREAKQPYLINAAKRLSVDELTAVMSHATAEEMQKLAPILADKQAREEKKDNPPAKSGGTSRLLRRNRVQQPKIRAYQ